MTLITTNTPGAEHLIQCDECGAKPTAVVQYDAANGHNWICVDCVRRALELLEESKARRSPEGEQAK